MLRYECTEPGFEQCFVEFSDSWTRGDVRRYWTKTETDEEKDEWLHLVQGKIRSCYLVTVTGPAITEGEQLTEAAMDDMDVRLFQWFTSAVLKAVADIADLGNAAGRRLWDTSEKDTASRPKS